MNADDLTAKDILQYFTFVRKSIFLTMMLMMLLRTQTLIDPKVGLV